MDHQEWFARLAQRLIGTLGALLDEGRLYEVDARLRPSGHQGLLVTSYASFDRYHQEDAAPWERVALLRARPVFLDRFAEPTRNETAAETEGEAAPDLTALLEQATYERPIDLDQLRSDLRRMRDRIEKERVRPGPGVIHLRFSPGGLTDLEFLAAFEQLRRGRDDRGLRTAVPYLALSTLVERGLVPEGEALLDDYRFLQRASLRLRLLRDEPDDRLDPRDHAPLARSLGLSQEALLEELRTRMARIRQVWTQALG
jgi:[glutamine synthetase] adenylyltransferase / [glutamine synthetase]-adenylyl-L-tyrosine phosphorylase